MTNNYFYLLISHIYRELSSLAREYMCIVATSVPREGVFSKSGQLISACRSRLKADDDVSESQLQISLNTFKLLQ